MAATVLEATRGALFGLGADASTQSVRVRWPDGRVEEFRDLAPDRY